MKRVPEELRGCAVLFCVLLSAALLAGPAMAEPPDGAPTSEQMVQQLRPHSASRGLVIAGAGALAPAVAPSIDLAVSFEFNSARLTADAELLLDRLGAALRDPALASSHFRIAGHTDGVGGAGYNQHLSEDRSRSVKRYLVEHYGIADQRLSTIGYGSSRLVDQEHPEAAVNRRVEVTNIGSGG